MRAKIIKRWAILVAVLSLIGGTGFLTQRFQVTRLAQSVAEQADSAVKQGEFAKAQQLYGEHLIVFPEDVETKIKYADTLLKAAPSPKQQNEALQIYAGILRRYPARPDVRRKQMELKVAMGNLADQGAEADVKMLLALDENKNDGHLRFLMGRCREAGKNDEDAVKWYQEAIALKAPERIEAYQQLAMSLHRLEQPEKADEVIKHMVDSDPTNYLVYLARGRYLRQLSSSESKADLSKADLSKAAFQKALELNDSSPDVYLELAELAATKKEYEAARQILENGLKKAPAAARIYEALATLELRNGHTDQAVKILRQGLKSPADKSSLRAMLAELLAQRGDTSELLVEIDELNKIGVSPVVAQFLKACYYVNSSEFREARQLLVPLESIPGLGPRFKARINNLLAQCYSRLSEPEMQKKAYIWALTANPQDVPAKLGLINFMVNEGDIAGAIKEYRALVKQVPQVSLPLARLLIRNRQRPMPQHDSGEVKSLIDSAEKSSPESVDVAVTRADFYMAQDKLAEAQGELERAKSRFPKSLAIWGAQANLLAVQKQFDEAQHLLDQAKSLLGDPVELRLQRARLSAIKGGPQVLKDLNELGQDLEQYSKEDRRKLLNGLVAELIRQQDLQDAMRLWSRLAEQEPNDLELRLNLLDLALQIGNSDEIDKNIKRIGEIEGSEGLLGRYCQVRYLIWQAAQRASAKDPQEALRLRTKARVLLNELASHRADWSMIPLALAELEQQELAQLLLDQKELAQGDLKAGEIQAKEESIIRSYRRAIDLGHRGSAVVRRTVQLLFKNKQGKEALDLLNSIPVESQIAGDLGRQASQFALDSRDFQRAEAIARKIVAANPGDFQERIWLVRILLSSGNLPDAENEIHQAVELAKTDPNRRITLVEFLVLTKQPEKAVKAIQDAEASLPQSQAPLALAQCCELMGRFYKGNNDGETKKWYTEAKKWFEKAKAAQPSDFSIARRLVDFLRRTDQIDAVEAQLDAILKQGTTNRDAETVAWARRTLALTLASSTDIQRVRKALSLLEPVGQASAGGKGTNALQDPEDLRALARVLAVQRSVQDRKRAIEVLESLVTGSLANAEDRFLMAQLYEMSGNWPKARDAYRDLNLRVKSLRDLETLSRRPFYLAQFVSSLLRNHKAGDDQDLTEAQLLVDELQQLQPDQFSTLVLQVEVHLARNQPDQAIDLIQSFAKRPDLAPNMIGSLAQLAEKLNRSDVAEQLYRRFAALLTPQDGVIVQAKFLGRHGRVKEALDLCEPLWANPQNVEPAARACIEVLTASNDPPDPTQVDRVIGWLEQAIKQQNGSALLLAALANCRERQGKYDQAKTLYENATKQNTPNTPASSSTNSTIAMAYNNLAWLLALTGDQGKNALVNIDHAIKLVGAMPEYRDTRGIVYLSLKRTQDAIDDLEIAVKADPSPAKLFHLTQAYLQANKKEEAKHYWRVAMDKKLDQLRFGPRGLHPLEQSAYQQVLNELGAP
jgi:cellulose synthase operon protein C